VLHGGRTPGAEGGLGVESSGAISVSANSGSRRGRAGPLSIACSAGCCSQPFAYPDRYGKDDIGRQMLGDGSIEQDPGLRRKFLVTTPVQGRHRDSWRYRKDMGGIGEGEGKASQLLASALECREIVAETIGDAFCRDGMGTAEKSGAPGISFSEIHCPAGSIAFARSR